MVNGHEFTCFPSVQSWTHTVNTCQTQRHGVQRSMYLPEMRKDILYYIDIGLDGTGDIMRASCACPPYLEAESTIALFATLVHHFVFSAIFFGRWTSTVPVLRAWIICSTLPMLTLARRSGEQYGVKGTYLDRHTRYLGESG